MWVVASSYYTIRNDFNCWIHIFLISVACRTWLFHFREFNSRRKQSKSIHKADFWNDGAASWHGILMIIITACICFILNAMDSFCLLVNGPLYSFRFSYVIFSTFHVFVFNSLSTFNTCCFTHCVFVPESPTICAVLNS